MKDRKRVPLDVLWPNLSWQADEVQRKVGLLVWLDSSELVKASWLPILKLEIPVPNHRKSQRIGLQDVDRRTAFPAKYAQPEVAENRSSSVGIHPIVKSHLAQEIRPVIEQVPAVAFVVAI